MSLDKRYTLTSYEPVSITVTIPHVTPDDVEEAMYAMAGEKDGNSEDAMSPAWVKKNLGFDSINAFRKEASKVAQERIEEEAFGTCAELVSGELGKRLVGEPDEELYKSVREDAALRLKLQLDDMRMSLRAYIERTGTTIEDLNAALDLQANVMAHEQAAIAAYAAENNIVADPVEWPQLLGVPEEELPNFILRAKGMGRYEALCMAATNSKALVQLVREAHVEVVRE